VQKAAKIKKETYDRLFFTVVLSNIYPLKIRKQRKKAKLEG
jgi:hypothetical protein